jgi:hypothetical protein
MNSKKITNYQKRRLEQDVNDDLCFVGDLTIVGAYGAVVER